MAWAYVLIAGILEVVWSFSLKASEGFTKLLPSLATVFFMILSFVVLSQGMKSLPLGTAYAVWTGIGAVGAALVGIVVLGESASLMRVAGIAFIVVGIGSPRTDRPSPKGNPRRVAVTGVNPKEESTGRSAPIPLSCPSGIKASS